MSERKVAFAPQEFYHVYNRGNSKQVIFKERSDYERFQTCLYVANGTVPFVYREIQKDEVFDFERGEQLVHIGAYCLMPNHFHILLTPAVEHGVKLFMQKLTTGYSMYFNKKYERTGGLFEGRFKSQHADSDEYLKYLFSYIHLNPLKLIQHDWREQGIQDLPAVMQHLQEYSYSSFPDYKDFYIGPAHVNRKEGKIFNKDVFPEYFPTGEAFEKEIFEWITFQPQLQ